MTPLLHQPLPFNFLMNLRFVLFTRFGWLIPLSSLDWLHQNVHFPSRASDVEKWSVQNLDAYGELVFVIARDTPSAEPIIESRLVTTSSSSFWHHRNVYAFQDVGLKPDLVPQIFKKNPLTHPSPIVPRFINQWFFGIAGLCETCAPFFYCDPPSIHRLHH